MLLILNIHYLFMRVGLIRYDANPIRMGVKILPVILGKNHPRRFTLRTSGMGRRGNEGGSEHASLYWRMSSHARVLNRARAAGTYNLTQPHLPSPDVTSWFLARPKLALARVCALNRKLTASLACE